MSYITHNTPMWKLVKKWQLVEMIAARESRMRELALERDEALKRARVSETGRSDKDDRIKALEESLDRAAMDMAGLEGELSKAHARIAEMELGGGKNE